MTAPAAEPSPAPAAVPSPAAAPDAAVVFVTVGTDHHRFDRLVDWVDEWARRRAHAPVLVQHGHSRPAAAARNEPMLTIDEMGRAFAAAVVVVCGGGPGTVMDARAAGRLPVVVPRQAALGEAVDDHQRDFAERLAASGKAVLADDRATLHALLDRALADPDAFRTDPSADPEPLGLQRIPALLDALVGRFPPPEAAADAGRRRTA